MGADRRELQGAGFECVHTQAFGCEFSTGEQAGREERTYDIVIDCEYHRQNPEIFDDTRCRRCRVNFEPQSFGRVSYLYGTLYLRGRG